MSDTTARDVAWFGVLKLLFDGHHEITPDHVLRIVELPEEKRRTVKRSMRGMEELGILKRDTPFGHSWQAGPVWHDLYPATAPSSRDVDDIVAVDRCDYCEVEPAALILTDGDWECYNCGHDPDESF